VAWEQAWLLVQPPSIMNLPNADNSAGWTLGTYGEQTIPIQPQKTIAQINKCNSPLPNQKSLPTSGVDS